MALGESTDDKESSTDSTLSIQYNVMSRAGKNCTNTAGTGNSSTNPFTENICLDGPATAGSRNACQRSTPNGSFYFVRDDMAWWDTDSVCGQKPNAPSDFSQPNYRLTANSSFLFDVDQSGFSASFAAKSGEGYELGAFEYFASP